MDEINPIDVMMETIKKGKTKQTAPLTAGEKPKRTYRVNLALRSDIGEELKRRADAENRSVNNYIEQILLDHFNR